MNDMPLQLPLEPAEPAAPAKPAPRKRKLQRSAPSAVAAAPGPEAVGGFVGLWRALTGKPIGAGVKGDAGLTMAFALCLAGGTLLCGVGATSAPFAREIGFAGPLAATLAYPIWGAMIGAAGKPSLRERLADNAYYLGFIFTQIALLVGFLPAAFGAAALQADQIIRFFGIALGASLIGLVARTILIQMSYTVDEAADVVSGEVSSLARQVSEQSKLVLDHFETLVARLAITHAKLTTELHSGMTGLTDTVAGYNKALQDDAAALHAGVTAASAAAEQTAAVVERQQAHLADTVGAVAEAIKRLQGTLTQHLQASSDRIQATTAALESEVQSSSASLRAATTAMEETLGSIRQLNVVTESLELIDARVGDVSQRIGQIDERVAGVGSAVDTSLRTLDEEVNGAARRSREQAERIAAEATEAVTALERTLQNFRAELDRVRV